MTNSTGNPANPMQRASEPQATWAQKIVAIKLAAERVGKKVLREVEFNLNEGVEHMEYKDYKEFDCDSEEQYIFGEAVHLIEELDLPFNEALCEVLAQAGNSIDADQVTAAGDVARLLQPKPTRCTTATSTV